MRYELTASTDAAMCVLFDPAALSHLLELPWDEISSSEDDGVLHRDQTAGNLSLYSVGSDGTFLFHIYINEKPASEMLSQAVCSFENALLRIPSGNLCAAGYEYLPQKEQGLNSIADYDIHALSKAVRGGSLGSNCAIASGNYSVDGYGFNVGPGGSTAHSRSVGEIFRHFLGKPEKERSPAAIFVMTRLPERSDISGMKGEGLWYSWS